jgi:L-threonylcarbamoyladenylate synthase
MVITLTPRDSLDEAVSAFKRGGVIAYPTETFYGLGVDPFNPGAIEKLFRLKGRSFKDPIPLIAARADAVEAIVEEVGPIGQSLIERYWPGPLTIIFNAKKTLPGVLTAHTGKVGVRVPGSYEAQRLASAVGSLITSTSANPTGSPPPNSAKGVLDYFDGLIDVIIDGGTLAARKPSTVVDVTGGTIELIREGAIARGGFSDIN